MKSKPIDTNLLFRAYDIRGKYGNEINPLFMFRLGIAVGDVGKVEFGENLHVYVGYDIRQTSQLLAYSFISGLASTGTKISFSNTPFPFGVVMYSGLKSNADFTTFITASHLPPNWNGIKFYYGDGVGFAESRIVQIRDAFNKTELNDTQFTNWKDVQTVSVAHFFSEYISYFKEKFQLESKLKILMDCGNGSASLSAPDIFKKCKYEVVEQWCTVDSSFPNRSSEPTEESLKILREKIKLRDDIDFGVGFDGDGDRAVIIDDKGNLVPADIIAILMANYLRNMIPKSSKPLVLANIECSSVIERQLSHSHTIKRIAVGHTFLTLEARENRNDCILGVESSGHFVFPQYFLFDDALLLPLILGKFLENNKEKLSYLVNKIPTMHSKRNIFKCSDLNKFDVVNNVFLEIKDKYKNINTLDGVAINVEGKGYVLIRSSNTSPKIRIFVESNSPQNLDSLYQEFSQLLEKKIDEISN